MFDVQAFFSLRQRNAFAHMPELPGLRQAFGDHGVAYAALGQGSFKQTLELRTCMRFRFLVRAFEQHTKGGAVMKRHFELGKVLDHQAQRKLTHHFKAGQAGAQMLLGQTEQGHGLVHRGNSGPGGQPCSRQGVELERGGGDDAQRAFAADVEVAQVIAGVVFAQARQAVPDLAGGGHHFEAKAEIACIAVAQHLRAAGVGGQVAAQGAAALCGQTERK